jgi:hypothetical protein
MLIQFIMTRPEHQEVQEALASQPSTQDALMRLLLGAALPCLAAAMDGASAALDGSSSADAARAQQQTFQLGFVIGAVLDADPLLPALRRHLNTHGSGGALRCAVRVLTAAPLRCPNGMGANVYSNLLLGAFSMTALLAGSHELSGDRGLTAEQRACAWELLRLLPRLVALLRAAEADARQRPALVDLCAAPCTMVAHVAMLVCEQSGISSVAKASEWAVATEAALGLLPLLDELHAGWDAPKSPIESPLQVGVRRSDVADMAFNIASSLLEGGISSANTLWSEPDMLQRAEEAARTGAFDALVRLHARVCRLAFWLPTRSSPGLLPEECLQLPQDTLQDLFLLMWDISCCAEAGAVEGVERRQGRCGRLAVQCTPRLWHCAPPLLPLLPPSLPQARPGSLMHAGGKPCELRCFPTWLPCISALLWEPRWPARRVRHPSRPTLAWTACMRW